jgi:hypothetical protein
MIEESSVAVYRAQVHRLARDTHGHLVFTDEHGKQHAGIVPVQAFPIDAPGEHVSLVSSEGYELAFIPRLSDMDAEARTLVIDEIARREFMPVIERLLSVSTFSTPSTWKVRTDRGMSSFVLKGEEDIRRLRSNGLLITDNHGLTYRVMDMRALDRQSRKLLDRFL